MESRSLGVSLGWATLRAPLVPPFTECLHSPEVPLDADGSQMEALPY